VNKLEASQNRVRSDSSVLLSGTWIHPVRFLLDACFAPPEARGGLGLKTMQQELMTKADPLLGLSSMIERPERAARRPSRLLGICVATVRRVFDAWFGRAQMSVNGRAFRVHIGPLHAHQRYFLSPPRRRTACSRHPNRLVRRMCVHMQCVCGPFGAAYPPPLPRLRSA
jgi:hypothetical protein